MKHNLENVEVSELGARRYTKEDCWLDRDDDMPKRPAGELSKSQEAAFKEHQRNILDRHRQWIRETKEGLSKLAKVIRPPNAVRGGGALLFAVFMSAVEDVVLDSTVDEMANAIIFLSQPAIHEIEAAGGNTAWVREKLFSQGVL
jgi:hypothetical protein